MFVWVCFLVCASAGRFVTAQQVMRGQPHEVSANSAEVLTAARSAVVECSRDNAEDQFACLPTYNIMNVTSAEIQVVAGINYILEVQLGRTMCKTSDGKPCVYHFEPKELHYHFIVTEIPWKDSRVLTQKKCHLHNY